ncbi:MAG: rhodanese-like domain-containing protein [Verrucomicrobiaceae bacterium]|nr:rhodanese-like domain-containing protein [Verrucomicrobiaceae bacterium]
MLWFVIILIIVIAGWHWFEGQQDKTLFKAAEGKICVNLHAAEAKAFLEIHPETQVLDVRSDVEFRGGALPGAIHVSIGDAEFDHKVSMLNKAKPVLVYCAGGMRSRQAVGRLKALEFENIQHLHRGYNSW